MDFISKSIPLSLLISFFLSSLPFYLSLCLSLFLSFSALPVSLSLFLYIIFYFISLSLSHCTLPLRVISSSSSSSAFFTLVVGIGRQEGLSICLCPGRSSLPRASCIPSVWDQLRVLAPMWISAFLSSSFLEGSIVNFVLSRCGPVSSGCARSIAIFSSWSRGLLVVVWSSSTRLHFW